MTSCKTVRASSSQCQACDSAPLQDSPSNTLVGSANARVPLNSCLPPFRSVVSTKLSPSRLSMFRRRVSRPIKVRIDETTRVSRGLRGVLQTHKVFAPGNTDGRPCAELSVWSHDRYKCANIVCPSKPLGALLASAPCLSHADRMHTPLASPRRERRRHFAGQDVRVARPCHHLPPRRFPRRSPTVGPLGEEHLVFARRAVPQRIRQPALQRRGGRD